MLDETKVVEVVNFGGIGMGYDVPELHVSRFFMPWETKKIPIKEILALSYIPGGRELLVNFFAVHDEEVLAELGIQPEEEYYWTEEDIIDMLTNGSVEKLADVLEFAPRGIVNNVKRLAVELKINDMNKRQTIQDFTGFNVNKSIEFNNMVADEAEEDTKPKVSKRRVPTNK